jgi:hypothetical protein
MVGENVKMLCEQIEKEKDKTTTVKMRGLELTDIQIFVATQSLGCALFGRGNDTPTSEGGEGTSYSGSGIDKIQEGDVSSKRGAMYFQRKEHMRRWH